MHTSLDDDAFERSVDDVEFLVRSDHRVGVLRALADGPRDRATLCEETDASSPTMGRVLGDFEERGWVVRDGSRYELTRLGTFVVEEFVAFCESFATERKLRDVWSWLPREMAAFDVDLLDDAVVSYPGPGYPYEPVERITQLIDETGQMAGFGTTVFKTGNLEAMHRNLLAGMELEYIYSPPILDTVVAWNPEKASEALSVPNATILLHEDLPDRDRCGIGIFDDRIGICCHDAETGMLRAVIDTEAPEAREWAESVYRPYREEARPVDSPVQDSASDAIV